MSKQYEEMTAHDGSVIYPGFDMPENIDGLDPQIVINTIEIREFYAMMSDDYRRQCEELEYFANYRRKVGLPPR